MAMRGSLEGPQAQVNPEPIPRLDAGRWAGTTAPARITAPRHHGTMPEDSKKLMLASSGSDAAEALGGQGGLDVGAVIVRMPDGDLGEEPDPAVVGG